MPKAKPYKAGSVNNSRARFSRIKSAQLEGVLERAKAVNLLMVGFCPGCGGPSNADSEMGLIGVWITPDGREIYYQLCGACKETFALGTQVQRNAIAAEVEKRLEPHVPAKEHGA